MTDHKKHFSLSKIYDIFLLLYLLYQFSLKALKLFAEEAHLVKRNLRNLALFYLVAFSLITSVWVGFSALLCLWLTSLHFSPAAAISMILGLNIVLLVGVCVLALRQENNLFFPETRDLIQNYFKTPPE